MRPRPVSNSRIPGPSQNAKTKPKKKQNKPAANGQQKRPKAQACETSCVRRYLHARLDPFSRKAIGACLPIADGGATFKYTTTSRAHITSIGSGCVITFLPRACKDLETLSWTTGISGGTSFNGYTRTNGQVARGSPFASTSFGGGELEQRCVGWGMKVSPTGPRLSAAGVSYSYATPSGGSLNGTSTPSEYLPVTNCQVMNNNRMVTMVNLMDFENSTKANEWFSSSGYRGLSAAYTGGLYAGPVFAYCDGSVTSVWVDVIAHWEVRGRLATPIGTTNEADPEGYFKSYSAISDVIRTAGNILGSPDQLLNAANNIMYGARVWQAVSGSGSQIPMRIQQ